MTTIRTVEELLNGVTRYTFDDPDVSPDDEFVRVADLPATVLAPRVVTEAENRELREFSYRTSPVHFDGRLKNASEWFDAGWDAALAALGFEVQGD